MSSFTFTHVSYDKLSSKKRKMPPQIAILVDLACCTKERQTRW